MSFNAAALKLMADKGLSAHDIAEIASANEARSAAAVRQKRYRDNKRDVTRDVTPSPNERDILTPTRDEKPSPKGEVKKVSGERLQTVGSCLRTAFPPPLGVTDEQWTSFRSQRKKPLNQRSYTLLSNKLSALAEAGWPPGDMIDLAIERGWETVFEPRKFGNERSTANPLSEAVTRILGDGRANRGAGEDAGAGGAVVHDLGTARALAARGG